MVTSNVHAKTIKVAVIDTGFDMKYKNQVKLCETGHKSFVDNTTHDYHGHGTHISGLIEKYAKDSDYCQVILKYYRPKHSSNNLMNTIKAFKYAIELGVDVINYSGGGLEPSETEREQILLALSKGIQVVVAAGNERSNLNLRCNYYPACYDKRITVVGNLNGRKVASTSNYGDIVDEYIQGTDVRSINGLMSGTSQSTAIKSGKVVKDLDTRYSNLHDNLCNYLETETLRLACTLHIKENRRLKWAN